MNGEVATNENGKIVSAAWDDLVNHYQALHLDEFVVMPNHVHGILFIKDASVLPGTTRAGLRPAPTLTGLPEVIRAFKSFSARRINQLRRTPGARVWQRNYYERVIRNENELTRAREYILNNPRKWSEDQENPANLLAS